MFTTAAPCTPSLPPLAAEAVPPAAPHRARSTAPGIEPAPAPPLRANPPDPSAPPPPSAATAHAVSRHRSESAPPAGGARILGQGRHRVERAGGVSDECRINLRKPKVGKAIGEPGLVGEDSAWPL